MELLFSPFTVAVLVVFAVMALGVALRPNTQARVVKQRAAVYLEDDPEDLTTARQLEGSFVKRAIFPILKRVLRGLGRFAPTGALEDVHQKLVVAGRPGGLSAADFLGLCILLGTLGAAGGLMVGQLGQSDIPLALVRAAAGGILGYMAPRFWLSSRLTRRKSEIQHSLPDALDMLTICVEAGLAFEAGMLRVSERWSGPLSQEFARVVAEIRLGVLRSQALRRMAERCACPDVSSFVAVLVQADSMGTSIAQVVHSQSEQLRVLRRQRAEEKANKAPIKMLIPMVLFIFPALFVVILGPGVPQILSALGSAGQ